MKNWFLILIFLVVPTPIHAVLGAHATYYLDLDAGVNGDGTAGSPYNSIANAASAQSGGNIFVILNDTYSVAIASVPAGTADKFTIIKASYPWKVMISQALALTQDLRNFHFDGIKWDANTQNRVAGTNFRFTRCIFKDGDASGNSSTVTVGDGDNVASRGLFEDCIFTGAGGRYKMQSYNSNMLIFRRCIAHHNNGWDDGGTENPASGFTIYETSTTFLQNCMVINSTNVPDTYQAAFYVVDNGPHETSNIHFMGNMVVGSEGIAYRGDANLVCSSWTAVNNVAVDARDGGMSWGSGSQDTDAMVRQFTFLMASMTVTSFGKGFGDFGLGTKNIKNGIVANYTNGNFDGVSATYYDVFNSGVAPGDTGEQTYNPRLNGLVYLTRVEAGSNLANDGNGGPLGATIEKRWGTSGTLYGETGYNTITSDNLWPWPNEKAIKGELCKEYSYELCGSQNFSVSITSYVVGYTARFTSPYADSTSDFEGEAASAGGGDPAPASSPVNVEFRGRFEMRGSGRIQ